MSCTPQEYKQQYDLPSLDTWIHIEFPQLLRAYEKAQGHLPEPDFEWAAFQTYRRYMEPDIWTFEKMLQWELNGGKEPTEPTKPANPSVGPVPSLSVAGPLFKEDNGKYHRVKSVTAFNLLDQFSQNKNIDPFLDKYSRSNRVRVFAHTSWEGAGWSYPSKSNARQFIEHLLSKNKATSLCLLTDNDQSKISPAKELVSYLNQFDFPGLLLEAVNEPLTHDKIDSSELKNVLSNSKYLWGSGIYEDLKKFFGKVGYIHTPRDDQWPRKAKDAIEAYRGGGPNSPDEPACRVPWILDEPIRPDQALSFGDMEKVKLDYYTYGALGSLTSAGVTFHCESAKLGKLPDGFEFACYNMLMDGLEVFPTDAALGDYEHLRDLEEPDSGNPTALRIFRVGRYVVIVRNRAVKIPSNWKSLDNYKVCYATG